jgi:predicted metal-dependent HD superfamily phosphohydrolase
MLQLEVAEFVVNSFESPDAPVYPYHNLVHTRNVVMHTEEMAGHYQVAIRDRFIVTTAAWFHDIGHLYGPMQGHEERGAQVMKIHLHDQPAELLTAIRRCILATKMPSHPVDLLEQILCDADTYHLGTDLFRETDPLVHQEMIQRFGPMTDESWRKKTLAFMRQHAFFTDYCQTLLNKKKQENIAWVEAQM